MVVKDYRDYLKTRYGKSEFTKEVPKDDRQPSHIRKLEILTENEAGDACGQTDTGDRNL